MNWECSCERACGAGGCGGPVWDRQRLIHEVGEVVMMRTDTSHMRPPQTVQGVPWWCVQRPPCARTHAHTHTCIQRDE